ncbi:MAG: HAMP domain-containing protein [Spirulina sp.]
MASNVVTPSLQSPASRPTVKRWLSIRWTLPLMMLVPLVMGIGLTGTLAFYTSRAAVAKLINTINTEVTNRIEQRLDDHITQTAQLADLVEMEMIAGGLRADDLERMRQYFWHLMQYSNVVDAVYYGDQRGDFILMGRLPNGTFRYARRDASTGDSRQAYTLNDQGDPVGDPVMQPYDPRQRQWYKDAQASQQSLWTEVYYSANPPDLTLTRAAPLPTVAGEVPGVIAVDVYLESLSQFLNSLKVSENGKAFIVDLNPSNRGELVAVSQGLPFEADTSGRAVRLQAQDSPDPQIQATAQYLAQNAIELTDPDAQKSILITLNGQRHWVEIRPFRHDNLNWLMVVTVPEADFAGEIYQNARRTLWWGLAITGAVTLLSVALSRWLTRPIQRLSQTANEVKQNQYPADDLAAVARRPDELGELAMLFEDMALVVMSREQGLSEQVASLRAEIAEYGTVQDETTKNLLQLLQRARQARQAYVSSNTDAAP